MTLFLKSVSVLWEMTSIDSWQSFVWKVTPENHAYVTLNSSLLRSVIICDKIKQTEGQKQICVFNHGSASSTHISNPT